MNCISVKYNILQFSSTIQGITKQCIAVQCNIQRMLYITVQYNAVIAGWGSSLFLIGANHLIRGHLHLRGGHLGTALHSKALHCTALHCTALHCTALHCTALHCTALHCTALHCTALHCTALDSLKCTALDAQNCIMLPCSAVQCTALMPCTTPLLN